MGSLVEFLATRSDAVLLAIFNWLFWMLALGAVLFTFRRELGAILGGLSNVKFAGLSVQLKDRQGQIQAYITLGEAFVVMLSQSGIIIDQIWPYFPRAQLERLSTFAATYMKETAEDTWNVELLRNIALLLMRHERFDQAREIMKKLLRTFPNDPSCIHINASIQLHTRVDKELKLAVDTYKLLVTQYPDQFIFIANYMTCYSLLGRHKEAMDVLKQMMERFPAEQIITVVNDPLLTRTRIEAKDLFEETVRPLVG